MAKSTLLKAKKDKNDEFYTQFQDIEKEMNAYLDYHPNAFRNKTVLLPCDDPEWSNFTKYFAQNFEFFGLKKLISTSYAPDSKNYKINYQPSLFEVNDPQFDKKKTKKNGKIFTLTKDKTGDGKIDVNDLEWHYLKGDGDFNSPEIKKLRDDADIIITNPPFSLFRDFLNWILEANKQFVIIGNINAISYTEIFSLIKEGKMWLGATNFNTGMYFKVPPDFVYSRSYKFEKERNGEKVNRVPGVCWFTNLDHGRRHVHLKLQSLSDNLKYSKHKEIKGKKAYTKYDNYDAIDVPFTLAIPNDFDGIMGVPITFLDKYSPEQFEIIGQGQGNLFREISPKGLSKKFVEDYYKAGGTGSIKEDHPVLGYYNENGNATIPYMRILIKHKNPIK
jgi:Adenine-specific methyltransferase EcoRI